jgi:protein ImuA
MPQLMTSTQQQAVLKQLTQDIGRLESSTGRPAGGRPVSSAGCQALDALLPAGGYAAGSVVEYLRTTPACGASTLAWEAAAAAWHASAGGYLVVVDTQHNFYPPALASHGIDLNQVIVVRPTSQADAVWGVDQALRTPAVAAVVAELEHIDDRSARRLQLAAECGAGLALLIRSAAARKQPSWAEVQWLVRSQLSAPRPTSNHWTEALSRRRWWVQLARVRGGRAGPSVCLEIDPLTGQLKLASSSEVHLRNSHADTLHSPSAAPSQGAVHLAAQLAHAKAHSATEQQPARETGQRHAAAG